MDDLFWESNWEQLPEQVFLQRLFDIIHKDSWIVDGNYSKHLDVRARHANTIIFIDTTVIICLYRVIMRAIRLFLFRKIDSALPSKIIDGFKNGHTKIFGDFWGLIKFIVMFPLKDKRLLLKQILSYDKCNFIVLTYKQVKELV